MNLFARLVFVCLLPVCWLNAYSNPSQIMTISDGIVDFVLFVDENFLQCVPGKKGGCFLVDHDTILSILSQSPKQPIPTPGGSAVNMLKGLATLGHPCTLIAAVGEDQEGEVFLNHLKKNGINLLLKRSLIPTGKCLSIVTPDGERTMRTCLGASAMSCFHFLEPKHFESLALFHIEGYQLQHYGMIESAIHLAKQAGARISMDLASFETVMAHSPFIWRLLRSNQIDLLFANKDEAQALTGLSPEDACSDLSRYCSTVVVTLGEKGCLVHQREEQLWHPAFPVPAIDTTGAGDLFIGGFLSGFLKGYPLTSCAWMGCLLASQVVQVAGSEIPEERWEIIHNALNLYLQKRAIGDDDQIWIDAQAQNPLDRIECGSRGRVARSASSLVGNR